MQLNLKKKFSLKIPSQTEKKQSSDNNSGQHIAGAVKKKYIIVKLSDYENNISKEHESFHTLFSYVCRIDLSRNEGWELPKLVATLKSWKWFAAVLVRNGDFF